MGSEAIRYAAVFPFILLSVFLPASCVQIFFLYPHSAPPGCQPQAWEAQETRHPLGLSQSVSLLKSHGRRWGLGGQLKALSALGPFHCDRDRGAQAGLPGFASGWRGSKPQNKSVSVTC